MKDLRGLKLLILGGKPIGSCEIVSWAKQRGVYTIVSDFLSPDDSPAKRIADEFWDVSTADIEELAKRARIAKVDGVYAGVHEFNICQMIKLCKELDLPCYCSMEQWISLENKANFKKACKKFNIPVTNEYCIDEFSIDEIKNLEFPVITKPTDGSGSRGFSICYNYSQLKEAYEKAKSFSETGGVMIETFMDYRYSVIINYTIVNGHIIYSGISDKRSKKISDKGAPVMSFQMYPSEFEKEYLDNVNQNAVKMLENLGLENGVIWIEAFCKEGEFVFNEMGFRFGGSLTYYPVRHYTGIDQLGLQIEYALTGKNETVYQEKAVFDNDKYCILPVHVKPGLICKIYGVDELLAKRYIKAFVPVHFEGDTIQDWGSAQQVFAYIHYVAVDKNEASIFQKEIMNTIHVINDTNQDMLFNLFDKSII